MSSSVRVARLAWGVLALNLGVIVWGAFVRASGSGAGCGSHWPTCNGDVIPRSPGAKTLVEFIHRTTSGLALLGVLLLLWLVFRHTTKGQPARRAAIASFFFILLEAGIGAGLVLFEWVAGNKSLARGFVMSAHLINTFLLLTALVLTAWHLSGGRRFRPFQGTAGKLFAVAAAAMCLTAAAGGIAALGDTLFPATSLAHGLAQDASTTSHIFLRLRVLHPVFAVGTIALLWFASAAAREAAGSSARVRRVSWGLVGIAGVQAGAGLLDVVLLAPIWLQLVHLLLADLIWIVLILLIAETQSAVAERSPTSAAA